MVEFTGHFDGKVIMPDERVEIPVNIPLRVTIEPAPKHESQPVNWKRLLELADECAVAGPADLAERHDQYAHGKRVE
jgi:hypothetical protein